MPTYFERATSPDLYAQTLANAYLLGYRIYDPSLAASRDPEITDKLYRFPPIAAPLQVRHTSIAGRTWTVAPADEGGEAEKALAKVASRILGNLQNFTEARIHLARADVDGARFAEVEKRVLKARYGDGKVREWIVPFRLVDMRKENFRWRPDPEAGGPKAILEYALKSSGTVRWVPVPAHAPLVRHVIDDSEETLGYGRGLRDVLFFLFEAMTRTFVADAQAADRIGHGWLTLKLDRDAPGKPTVTNETLVTDATKALEKQRSKHIFVMDKGDELTMLAPPAEAVTFMKDLRESLTRMADRVIMGSTLFAGGGGQSEGSMARAETEADTASIVFDTRSDQLEESLTRFLVRPGLDDNRANIVDLGLGDADLPHYQTTRGRHQDPEAETRRVQVLLSAGVKLKADEVYDRIGYSRPSPEDEVLEGPQPGGMPGMPGGEGPPDDRGGRDGARPGDLR